MFLALCALIVVTTCWYTGLIRRMLRFRKIVQFSKTLHGPTIIELIKNNHRTKVLPFFIACNQKFGSRFGIWFGKDLAMFLTDPDDVKLMLSSHEILYKSKIYEILKPWLGEGLLIAGGEKWQRTRKFLTPAFHFNILKQFQGVMSECADVLIAKLEKEATGEPINIYPFVTLFALDVICETALGVKKNAQMKSGSDYVRAVQGICRIIQYRTFNILLRNNLTFQFSSIKRQQRDLLKVLHGETDKVIAERRKVLLATQTDNELPSNVDEDDANVYLSSKRRFAFLDMLLMAQIEGTYEISDLQIRAEVDTFMFEGHDTTSSAISFALYLLSINPEAQVKAYDPLGLLALSWRGG